MCCCCLPRCSIIFAGVWCLVVSLLWATLGFLGIGVYQCTVDVDNEITNPLFYLKFIYFFNRGCAEIPNELNIRKILFNIFNQYSDYTTPYPGYTIPDGWTWPPGMSQPTPFPLPSTLPDWPGSFNRVEETYTLMILYGSFNAAWAVTCLIVVVAAAMHVGSWFCYIPWILMTAANIVLDVVATVMFATDAIDAWTVEGLLETVIGLDLQQIDPVFRNEMFNQSALRSADGFTSIPSAVMALLSGRLGIFWLMNVIFLICVPMAVYRLSNEKRKQKKLPTYPHSEQRNHGYQNNSYMDEPDTKMPVSENYYSPAPGYPHTGDDPAPLPHQLRNRDLTSSAEAPGTYPQPHYLEVLHPQQNYSTAPGNLNGSNWANEQNRASRIHRTDSTNSSQPPLSKRFGLPPQDPSRDYLEPNKGFHNLASSAGMYEPPPLRTLPVTGEDEQRGTHINRTESNRSAFRPPVPNKNPKRGPAPLPPHNVDRHQGFNSNVERRSSINAPRPSVTNPPDELRSQLPWSYFGPRKPVVPKPKAEPVPEEGLEMPPVPVPDYTLHFGKTARPAQSNWPDDGNDSGADHRGVRRSSLLQNNRH